MLMQCMERHMFDSINIDTCAATHITHAIAAVTTTIAHASRIL